MLGAPVMTGPLTYYAPAPVVMPPVRTPAFQPIPPSPGVMVAVVRSVAAECPPCNPHALVSEVVSPVGRSALLPVPPAPGVRLAVYIAEAVDIPLSSLVFRLVDAATPPRARGPAMMSPGVTLAVGGLVAADYLPLNTRTLVSEVVPSMRIAGAAIHATDAGDWGCK